MTSPLPAATVAGLLAVAAPGAGDVLFTHGRAAWIPGYDPSTSAVPEGALANDDEMPPEATARGR